MWRRRLQWALCLIFLQIAPSLQQTLCSPRASDPKLRFNDFDCNQLSLYWRMSTSTSLSAQYYGLEASCTNSASSRIKIGEELFASSFNISIPSSAKPSPGQGCTYYGCVIYTSGITQHFYNVTCIGPSVSTELPATSLLPDLAATSTAMISVSLPSITTAAIATTAIPFPTFTTAPFPTFTPAAIATTAIPFPTFTTAPFPTFTPAAITTTAIPLPTFTTAAIAATNPTAITHANDITASTTMSATTAAMKSAASSTLPAFITTATDEPAAASITTLMESSSQRRTSTDEPAAVSITTLMESSSQGKTSPTTRASTDPPPTGDSPEASDNGVPLLVVLTPAIMAAFALVLLLLSSLAVCHCLSKHQESKYRERLMRLGYSLPVTETQLNMKELYLDHLSPSLQTLSMTSLHTLTEQLWVTTTLHDEDETGDKEVYTLDISPHQHNLDTASDSDRLDFKTKCVHDVGMGEEGYSLDSSSGFCSKSNNKDDFSIHNEHNLSTTRDWSRLDSKMESDRAGYVVEMGVEGHSLDSSSGFCFKSSDKDDFSIHISPEHDLGIASDWYRLDSKMECDIARTSEGHPWNSTRASATSSTTEQWDHTSACLYPADEGVRTSNSPHEQTQLNAQGDTISDGGRIISSEIREQDSGYCMKVQYSDVADDSEGKLKYQVPAAPHSDPWTHLMFSEETDFGGSVP